MKGEDGTLKAAGDSTMKKAVGLGSGGGIADAGTAQGKPTDTMGAPLSFKIGNVLINGGSLNQSTEDEDSFREKFFGMVQDLNTELSGVPLPETQE
jgi:hypothetical protein